MIRLDEQPTSQAPAPETAMHRRLQRSARRAFTLIELLVVVAIIALLISILLPSLSAARDQARTAKCGVQLRSIGVGVTGYVMENQDWIPGVNTSGATFAMSYLGSGSDINVLRSSSMPVQNFDWMFAALRYAGDVTGNRADRFWGIINKYQCPSNAGMTADEFYTNPPDIQDFTAKGGGWSVLSYLMPAHFQLWGRADAGFMFMSINWGDRANLSAKVPNADWEAYATRYRSKLGQVGNTGRKIMAADGTRYLTTNVLDFDIQPLAGTFGSFTSAGAWWCGDTSYGVKQGSMNWDGMTVNAGSWPEAKGHNLSLSYRHNRRSTDDPVTAQANKGFINAMFFDGHVAALNDRASREIVYWYPKGAVVQDPSEGMTAVPNGFEIP